MGNATCPEVNKSEVDQSSFWDSNGVHWDTHRIGWAIAGVAALITVLISMVSVLRHCRNYRKPAEQKQIIRILYMPPVYAIISFFSYRFFRKFTYYSLIEVVYESITLSAFLLLLIEYVAATAHGHSAENALLRKDKKALPFPFGFWRYRPTKAYFMYTLKWSVLQYVIIRPLASIAGIICEAYGVLCESAGFDYHWANVYIEAVDFVSITFALYGLIVFYGLTKEELVGRRPLAKFLSIKLIVMFTFYQSFIFSALEGKVIHATEYWTTTNVADGLTALCTTLEMMFFAGFMMWAFSAGEYMDSSQPATSIWRPLWDSVYYKDFAAEILESLRFFWDYARKKPHTHGPRMAIGADGKRMDFGEAFRVEGSATNPRTAPEEGIHLEPYRGTPTRQSDESASPVQGLHPAGPR